MLNVRVDYILSFKMIKTKKVNICLLKLLNCLLSLRQMSYTDRLKITMLITINVVSSVYRQAFTCFHFIRGLTTLYDDIYLPKFKFNVVFIYA